MFIMKQMLEEMPAPREDLSKYAPRIVTLHVPEEKIRLVIGKGGETINRIVAETGAKVDIDDDGNVFIASPDMASAEAAKKEIIMLTKDVEVGETYEGTVVRILTSAKDGAELGAFVNILPGKDGLLHISKIAKERIAKVTDVLNIGDKVTVKVSEIDEKERINLTRKGLEDLPIIKA